MPYHSLTFKCFAGLSIIIHTNISRWYQAINMVTIKIMSVFFDLTNSTTDFFFHKFNNFIPIGACNILGKVRNKRIQYIQLSLNVNKIATFQLLFFLLTCFWKLLRNIHVSEFSLNFSGIRNSDSKKFLKQTINCRWKISILRMNNFHFQKKLHRFI